MPSVRRIFLASWLTASLSWSGVAAAQPVPSDQPSTAAPALPQQQPQTATPPAEPEAKGLWERDQLLGDLGGLRSRLEEAGIKLGLQEQSEVLGNVSGGLRRGFVYDGATQVTLGLDAAKLLGVPGGRLNVSAYQIHGRGLSANNLGNLNTASGIEAPRATRLFELWYEQALFDGRVSVRIGQIAADQEFLVSTYGALFINSSFGWPTLTALNLPEGGPAYPLATPGVRLQVKPTDDVTALVGVFNGNPADNGAGTSFRVNQGTFAIAELQYALNSGDDATGLPGTYKLGAWYNSNAFADQYLANDGLPLAHPASSGTPLLRRNNWSVYGAADQLVWRVPGSKDQGVGVFVRLMGSPGDRNLVDFFANVGATYKGVIPGREDDTLGIGVAYVRIGDSARRFDTSTRFFSGGYVPIGRNETVLEVTYQFQVAGWWTVQPDFQYVFNPGGGIPNLSGTARAGDAAVFGLRTTITF